MPSGAQITMPGVPAAPESIDLFQVNLVSGTVSPFTGAQQIFDWQANYMRASVSMPAMPYAIAQSWVAFLKSLTGIVNYFQFSAAFDAKYPNDLQGQYWRLENNLVKWSITRERVYSIQFNCRSTT
jgi:hypothetical protein